MTSRARPLTSMRCDACGCRLRSREYATVQDQDSEAILARWCPACARIAIRDLAPTVRPRPPFAPPSRGDGGKGSVGQ